MEPIRVEIDLCEVPTWAMMSGEAYEAYVVCILKDNGVPITGGPIGAKVDFSKGVLTKWEEYETNKMIYTWKGKE